MAPTASTGGMLMSTVLYLGFFFVIMYFLIIRPQKKRDKQSSIKVGDEVLLNTGIYGKVVDIINDLFIIELGLNKSVRIPVKQVAVAAVAAPNLTIAKASEPVDDEDEYEDDEYEDGEYEDEDEE